MLTIENLHAYYGKSHVLHGVSFDVQPGEIVALLGRNGMGKSTLIRTLLGHVAQRDGHIKSADFFDVEKFPKATFKSTAVRSKGSDFVLAGDFTLHGVTREVELNLEFNGVNPGMGQGPVAGFEATTVNNRKDFDISIEMPLEGGGAVVGDKITITLEIEAGLQA